MPESNLLIGTTEGHAGVGTTAASSAVGFQDPFPYDELLSYPVRRFCETFMAAGQGQTLQFKPSWNDCVNLYRTLFTRGAMGSPPPNLIAGFSPGRLLGNLNPPAINLAQVSNFVDPVTGATINVANANVNRGSIDLAAVGSTTVVAQADNLMVVGLISQDPGLFTGPLVTIRRTDGSNYIRAFRQSATNLRVEKNVAGVATTEQDLTVPTAEPISGAAIGIRVNGTNMKVFLNGTMYGNFTMSAGAQSLTGTEAGFSIVDVARTKIDAFAVYKVS